MESDYVSSHLEDIRHYRGGPFSLFYEEWSIFASSMTDSWHPQIAFVLCSFQPISPSTLIQERTVRKGISRDSGCTYQPQLTYFHSMSWLTEWFTLLQAWTSHSSHSMLLKVIKVLLNGRLNMTPPLKNALQIGPPPLFCTFPLRDIIMLGLEGPDFSCCLSGVRDG